jgi:hypothetical protein
VPAFARRQWSHCGEMVRAGEDVNHSRREPGYNRDPNQFHFPKTRRH